MIKSAYGFIGNEQIEDIKILLAGEINIFLDKITWIIFWTGYILLTYIIYRIMKLNRFFINKSKMYAYNKIPIIINK